MLEPNDESLVSRSLQGDQGAFVALIRRYEQPLAALIRVEIGDPDHAEDVLQETLLDAWAGLRQLREPNKVRAWLLRIARNRCHDFHRSAQRRDLPTEDRQLEAYINRSGFALRQQTETASEILDAMDQVPPAEREAARLFYLEGFTIAEIAARSRCPEGTVKRRLFDARDNIRRTLGAAPGERRPEMSPRKPQSKRQPFSPHRPPIVITDSQQQPLAVDCPELRWWGIVPKRGERALYAEYSPPGWALTRAYELYAARPAEIHGVEGVEIDVSQWEPETGWMPSAWSIYGRLTDREAQYLATIFRQGDRTWLRTFFDEDYNVCWGQMARRLEDRGRFILQKDGSFQQVYSDLEASGAGVFLVKVGDRRFACLRVFQLEGAVTDPHAPLKESYVTENGRTVLVRHYCHHGVDDLIVDENTRLVLDEEIFVHWYDSLTGVACGIGEPENT